MIGSDRMAAVDRNAEALGVPRKQLMESSGNALAREVANTADPGDTVTIVAGRGNNGGDAFVAARFLSEYDVLTILLGRPESIGTDIARENWDALQAANLPTKTVTDSNELTSGAAAGAIDEGDVLVDAMLGTGIAGELREPEATAVQRMNETQAPIVAVDVPTGVDPDSGERVGVAIEAEQVVTFHDMKPGLDSIDATVTVADIGIPAAAELFVERGDLGFLERDPHSHKGDHGSILVVGGGPYTGAPALAAQAALRAGADLAHVACPAAVASEVQSYSENLIVHPLTGDKIESEHVATIIDIAADHDCVLIGPGWGQHEESLQAAEDLLYMLDGRVVVDADPLRVLPTVQTDAEVLCTPHAGEAAAMGVSLEDDWQQRKHDLEPFATDLGHTMLVKGPDDVITDGETTRINQTGNPGMTVGGTGDVLAGVASALMATQPPVRAGAIAAYVTGRAGDYCHDEQGDGLVATDLLTEIPRAMTDNQ